MYRPVSRAAFRKLGVTYDLCKKTKSEVYLALVPLLNSRKVTLLDRPRLLLQLSALERRTARGGRDSVDHPPRGHDDVINAAAGALVNVLGRPSGVSTAEIMAANRRGWGTTSQRRVF